MSRIFGSSRCKAAVSWLIQDTLQCINLSDRIDLLMMQSSRIALFIATCGLAVSGADGARRLADASPPQPVAPVNSTSSRESSLTP